MEQQQQQQPMVPTMSYLQQKTKERLAIGVAEEHDQHVEYNGYFPTTIPTTERHIHFNTSLFCIVPKHPPTSQQQQQQQQSSLSSSSSSSQHLPTSYGTTVPIFQLSSYMIRHIQQQQQQQQQQQPSSIPLLKPTSSTFSFSDAIHNSSIVGNEKTVFAMVEGYMTSSSSTSSTTTSSSAAAALLIIEKLALINELLQMQSYCPSVEQAILKHMHSVYDVDHEIITQLGFVLQRFLMNIPGCSLAVYVFALFVHFSKTTSELGIPFELVKQIFCHAAEAGLYAVLDVIQDGFPEHKYEFWREACKLTLQRALPQPPSQYQQLLDTSNTRVLLHTRDVVLVSFMHIRKILDIGQTIDQCLREQSVFNEYFVVLLEALPIEGMTQTRFDALLVYLSENETLKTHISFPPPLPSPPAMYHHIKTLIIQKGRMAGCDAFRHLLCINK
jgi:hypothetical protein